MRPFFSKRFPFFGTNALLILCVVFFMLPFALRGARMAITSMQNNVADWLPGHYEETLELGFFRKYFTSDQFVVISGPWCREGEPAFMNLVRKIREESLEHEIVLKQSKKEEELQAHRRGDELGLMYTGDYKESWGEQRERWLLGKKDQWYWINRQGELYKWNGQNNVIQGARRWLERSFNGRNKATGTYIATFGEPPDDAKGIENEFYHDPQKLCARPFKSIVTGPEIFEKMAGPDGTIRDPLFEEGDESVFQAKIEAHKRLTGALFGPTPRASFKWTFESLLNHVESDSKLAVLRSAPTYREKFERFIEVQVEEKFDGERRNLLNASQDQKLELWYRVWKEALELKAPSRQTCIIVTLNDPVLKQMDRAVGRPLLGKPRGRILELATGECGIDPENLHMGGPPSDNVAIDEEGTSTLLRLVSLSLLIGVGLAYVSFRSFRVTIMLFFVGGTAAISSLSYVWYAGSTMDAILMSMPSLVYVLGLSGAVHIVNYYRDACYEDGPKVAVETAIKYGWFPCTLAAFTTALGLISLYTSNLTPIQKFGFFSAIATMATVMLLFTYLPAALTVWSPGFKQQKGNLPARTGLAAIVTRVWEAIGEWVMRHHAVVSIVTIIAMGFLAYGVTQVKTSVHLLKLFDPDSKIIHDYEWMEEHLGELVPMEVVVCLDEDAQQEPSLKKMENEARANRARLAKLAGESVPADDDEFEFEYDKDKFDLKYSLLERLELSGRVRAQLEKFFGPEGLKIVGSGMSTDVFVPMQRAKTQYLPSRDNGIELVQSDRYIFNKRLNSSYDDMVQEDYLAVAGMSNLDVFEAMADKLNPEIYGREMWRVSIRLAALSDVDYGDFVADLKSVVEPIMTAYRMRTDILRKVQSNLGLPTASGAKTTTVRNILVFGSDPDNEGRNREHDVAGAEFASDIVDQTQIFSSTMRDLFENRGFQRSRKSKSRFYRWVDPNVVAKETFKDKDRLAAYIATFDCVVMIEDDELFDVDFIKKHSANFADCRNHFFKVDPITRKPVSGQLTAMQAKRAGQDVQVATIYTGIIPIVYKAQNQLLRSLINSIALAFVMIAFVMMLLLRNWRERPSPTNMLNVSGGMLSMLPNVFPILLIFGTMGFLQRRVDIGSMMTASVAMGVAVDDTIHFLNWYRKGLAKGLRRHNAIRLAYDRVALAMTQTTLIGGFGLSAFALSTFTPTQRFGVLMLFLLAAALIGDLIFLPALLAGPLGRFFGKERPEHELAESERSGGDGENVPMRVVGVDGDDELSHDVHPDSFKHLEPPEAENGDASFG